MEMSPLSPDPPLTHDSFSSARPARTRPRPLLASARHCETLHCLPMMRGPNWRAGVRSSSIRLRPPECALAQPDHDSVGLLFGIQLGGGTDINRAVAHCQQLVRRPAETVMVLITDLYEGGNKEELVQRAAAIVASGVNLIGR